MVRSTFSVLLVIQACLGTFFAAAANSAHLSNLGRRDSTACQGRRTRDAVAPKQNIWTGFSIKERQALGCFIIQWADENIGMRRGSNSSTVSSSGAQPRLNSTRGYYNESTPLIALNQSTSQYGDCIRPKRGPVESSVLNIDLIYPNKTDALAYIQGHGPAPPKYASFVLAYNDEQTATQQKFSIGPLPLSSTATKIKIMDWDSTRSSGGRLVEPQGVMDEISATNPLKDVFSSMKDIMDDLVGVDAAAGIRDVKRHGNVAWIGFTASLSATADAGNLLQQGLYFKVEVSKTSADNQTVTLLAIVYNGKVYDSVSVFRAAWSAPGFEKIPIPKDGDWTSMNRGGAPFPNDEEPGPRDIATSQRFSIDLKNQYIEWMGFSFYMSMSPSLGLGLHNINFDGERIIYELQMQEAIALYSANDPLRGQTYYLDSIATEPMGFGANLNKLVPGFDCPETSAYLDTPFMNGSICIFERDAGFPLSRHRGFAGNSSYVTVVKNNILVARTISTLGNYDYMFDYQFFYDGSLEVTVRASGYIEGTHAGGNDEHGFRIHDALSGAMHDHVINFKLDLDINGTANTMERIDIKPVTEAFTGSQKSINTMKIERSFIENEDQGKINWPANAASQYVVVNKDAKNPYGEYRGFRLTPGVGSPVHLIPTNSSLANGSANFATNHFYVTKRKDTEPHSASSMNSPALDEQHVDFDKFFDGEKIEQEDIVVWFNLGMHHVPHTGDLPVTLFQAAQSSLVISPHNFFTESPTKRVTQAVTVKVLDKENATSQVVIDYNGADLQSCPYDANSRIDLRKHFADLIF